MCVTNAKWGTGTNNGLSRRKPQKISLPSRTARIRSMSASLSIAVANGYEHIVIILQSLTFPKWSGSAVNSSWANNKRMCCTSPAIPIVNF